MKLINDPVALYSPADGQWSYDQRAMNDHWPISTDSFYPGLFFYKHNRYAHLSPSLSQFKLHGRDRDATRRRQHPRRRDRRASRRRQRVHPLQRARAQHDSRRAGAAILLLSGLVHVQRVRKASSLQVFLSLSNCGQFRVLRQRPRDVPAQLDGRARATHRGRGRRRVRPLRVGHCQGRRRRCPCSVVVLLTLQMDVRYPVGRRAGAPVSLGNVVGGAVVDEEGHFSSATALRLQYDVRGETLYKMFR